MTVHDLVGIPFPKTAPLFASDTATLSRVRHVEDLIEIHNELSTLQHQLDSAQKLVKADQSKVFDIAGMPLYLTQSLTIGCVVTYAKSFQSSGRLMLQAEKIFKGNPLEEMHEFLMDLRNKWFAHQELVGDRHHLFLFQDPENARIRLNPYGQHHHVLVSHGLDWEGFSACVNLCIEHVRALIASACESLESFLSPEQIAFINQLDKEHALAIYWDQQPQNWKSPFSSRGP